MTTENNSYCGVETGYRDGINNHEIAQMGYNYHLTMSPVKHNYISVTNQCRDIPYNEMLFQKIKDLYQEGNCNCRPPNQYLCKYLKAIENVPVCASKADEDCFEKMRNIATNQILLKPCTKLEYFYKSTPYGDIWEWPVKENELIFSIKFPYPPTVVVKEEYLIYDMVTLIGVIGGTLGLCIGLSLNDICTSVLRYMGIAFTAIWKENIKKKFSVAKFDERF